MLKEEKIYWIIGFICLALFAILTVTVKFCDVQPIGPGGSPVGLATMNNAFKKLVGTDNRSYIFSQYLGYCALAIVGYIALQGLGQWINRRSIRGVKPQVLLFGVFCVILGAIYVGFDQFVINYRPVLENGVLEPSYPSSHTLLAVFVYVAGSYELSFSIRSKSACTLLTTCFCLLGTITIVTRALSGYHWLSDILGSALLGAGLVLLYIASVIHVITKDRE